MFKMQKIVLASTGFLLQARKTTSGKKVLWNETKTMCIHTHKSCFPLFLILYIFHKVSSFKHVYRDYFTIISHAEMARGFRLKGSDVDSVPLEYFEKKTSKG